MHAAIDFVLTLILRLAGVVMALSLVIEGGLRHLLNQAGIRGETQSAVLVLAAILLIIAAVRLLGRVFGFLITLLLALMILNLLMPGFQLPTSVHP